jgi:predicted metal-dependent peptidase
MPQARVNLTQEEEDFFRVILYHAVSDEQAQPYLRKAFYRLIPVAVEGSKTMSIDEHWRVYIDFEEMMRRGSSYATGILHHEIWHPLRQHHKLIETLDAAPAGYNQGVIANLAADLEINDDIAHLIPANAIKGQRSVFKQYPENGIFAPYYDKMLEDLNYLEKYFPSIKETSVAQPPQQQPDGDSSDEDEPGQDGDTQEQAPGEAPDGAEQPNKTPGSGDKEESSEPSDSSSESDAGESDSEESDDSSQSPSSSSSPSEPQQEEESNQSQEGNSSSDDSSPDSEAGEGDESSSSGGSSTPPPFPGQGNDQSQDSSQSGGSEPVKQTPPFPGTPQKPASPFPKTPSEPQQAPAQEPSQNKGESENNSDQNDGDIEESDYWNHPECGSSTGNPAEYELPPGAAPEMSENEEANLTKAVARDIQDWLKENPGVGSGRGSNSLGDWAEQRLKAKTIPWQQELRGVFLSAAATVRGKLLYVRNKPSRRQPVPEFMFPALKAPKPTIGIGIDVSGSNLGNLRVILDEIVKMMKSMNVQGRDVEAFAVDVAVSKTKTVSNPLKLLDDLPVGGGTRMKPGYMKLAEMGKDVSILITDGWVDDYPEEQPKGKKRTKFITCIVMKERTKKNDSRVRKAKRIMGKWCKVIPIYVSEMKQSGS